jgi:hypothetical protein
VCVPLCSVDFVPPYWTGIRISFYLYLPSNSIVSVFIHSCLFIKPCDTRIFIRCVQFTSYFNTKLSCRVAFLNRPGTTVRTGQIAAHENKFYLLKYPATSATTMTITIIISDPQFCVLLICAFIFKSNRFLCKIIDAPRNRLLVCRNSYFYKNV